MSLCFQCEFEPDAPQSACCCYFVWSSNVLVRGSSLFMEVGAEHLGKWDGMISVTSLSDEPGFLSPPLPFPHSIKHVHPQTLQFICALDLLICVIMTKLLFFHWYWIYKLLLTYFIGPIIPLKFINSVQNVDWMVVEVWILC